LSLVPINVIPFLFINPIFMLRLSEILELLKYYAHLLRQRHCNMPWILGFGAKAPHRRILWEINQKQDDISEASPEHNLIANRCKKLAATDAMLFSLP
jgi:hypothetical protein